MVASCGLGCFVSWAFRFLNVPLEAEHHRTSHEIQLIVPMSSSMSHWPLPAFIHLRAVGTRRASYPIGQRRPGWRLRGGHGCRHWSIGSLQSQTGGDQKSGFLQVLESSKSAVGKKMIFVQPCLKTHELGGGFYNSWQASWRKNKVTATKNPKTLPGTASRSGLNVKCHLTNDTKASHFGPCYPPPTAAPGCCSSLELLPTTWSLERLRICGLNMLAPYDQAILDHSRTLNRH